MVWLAQDVNIRWVAWAVVFLGPLWASTAAQAAALPAPSTDVSVTNLTAFTGTVLNDTGNLSYAIGPGNTGTVREWVVSNASTALCGSCLSFVYQFQVSAGSIGRLAGNPYDSFTVDVAHFGSAVPALTGSVAGTFGANNADRDASGNTIDFDFTSPVTSPFSSFLLIANTNATASQTGSITLTTPAGGFSALTGFSPGQAAGVPEPATVLLLGSSVLALSVWRRRM